MPVRLPIEYADLATLARRVVPIGEASIDLGLTRAQLRRRVERGEIPGLYIGGDLYIPRDAVTAARRSGAHRG
jgi:hypothetical protein